MRRLLTALANLKVGLAPETKADLEAMMDGLGEAGADNPEGVKTVYVNLSNALLAIALHYEDVHAVQSEGGIAASRMNTRPEDTRALLRFLTDNRSDVKGFSSPFTKLSVLLDWVYDQMTAHPPKP